MFIMLTERTDCCKNFFEKKMSFEQYEIFQEIFKSINFFDTPVPLIMKLIGSNVISWIIIQELKSKTGFYACFSFS